MLVPAVTELRSKLNGCPLVPGAGIYWTSYYLVMNEMDQALTTGYEAVKCAAAIVLGIVLAFELPQKLFRRAGKTSGIK